jgi:hypothetical protein
MIISHTNKFTLLRVPKTGSTSLEASVRFCGAVDETDMASKTEDAFLPMQNIPCYKKKVMLFKEMLSIAERKKKMGMKLTEEERKCLRDKPRWMIFFEHNTLDDVMDSDFWSDLGLINHKQIMTYRHYGFLRDPIERYVSSFIFYQVWRGRKLGKTLPITVEAFHEFTYNQLTTNDNILFRPQKDWFHYRGEKIVEPLIFDNWSSEASRMIKELGFHPLTVYPRFKEDGGAKKRFPNGNPKAKDFIDPFPNIKNFIHEHFKEDINFYNSYRR